MSSVVCSSVQRTDLVARQSPKARELPRNFICAVTSLKRQQSSASEDHCLKLSGTRRQALLQHLALICAPAFIGSSPAKAGPLGEAAVSFWRSRQQQNGGAKLLAPIRNAQARLHHAGEVLSAASIDTSQLSEALQLVRASSMNCYIFEATNLDSFDTRASNMQQYFNLADPCTFRIIYKNIVDLSPEETKLEGQHILDSLIQSYSLLDDYIDRAIQGSPTQQQAQKQLGVTIGMVDQFEGFVKKVLGV